MPPASLRGPLLRLRYKIGLLHRGYDMRIGRNLPPAGCRCARLFNVMQVHGVVGFVIPPVTADDAA